jgi:hypothetical protein
MRQFTDPRALVTPRRLDLAVKYRLFRHFITGEDKKALELYKWMIEKRSGRRMKAGVATDSWKHSVHDYLTSAITLFNSMRVRGYSGEPIPISAEGELLNGSHRVAAAIAITIPAVATEKLDRRVWAPAWDADWFHANGLPEASVADLEDIMNWELVAKGG